MRRVAGRGGAEAAEGAGGSPEGREDGFGAAVKGRPSRPGACWERLSCAHPRGVPGQRAGASSFGGNAENAGRGSGCWRLIRQSNMRWLCH